MSTFYMPVLMSLIALLLFSSASARPEILDLNSTDVRTGCNDIDHCRTLPEIVTPAITALLAAIYLSVHQNVPRPHGSTWYWNALRSALIAFVTLVFPEWTCAWAVRSFIIAKRLLPKLEAARSDAMNRWYDTAVDPSTPSACKLVEFCISCMLRLTTVCPSSQLEA